MNDEFSMDVHFMRLAIKQAKMAADKGEVPVGAVLVYDQRIIGQAHNEVETLKDPTAHAEMIAITQGAHALGGWRLTNTTLYVTKEPCPMCAGAIMNARISQLYWGMTDPLRGGATSLFNILDNDALNHRTAIEVGLLEEECKAVMQDFFKERRSTPRPG